MGLLVKHISSLDTIVVFPIIFIQV